MNELIETYKIHPARTMEFDTLYSGLMDRVEKGLITVQKWRDLEMFTYSRDCTFDKAWDVFTLMARGLILCPSKKVVVATPFVKFFNHNEFFIELPNEPFSVTEKMDGSLITAIFWDNEWWCFTKGSFQSEQGIWATEWFRKNVNTERMPTLFTYCFEVIYPANRIVVRYDFEGLVLLAVIYHTGEEWTNRRHLENLAEDMRVKIVPQKQYASLDDMVSVAEKMDISSEGFVVRFENGLRLKIKGIEYLRLHKIISDMSPLSVWEGLLHCENMKEIEKQLPEEFRLEYVKLLSFFQQKFEEVMEKIEECHKTYAHLSDKELGKMKHPLQPFLFSCRKKNLLEDAYKDTKVRQSVFNLFRPDGNVIDPDKPSFSWPHLF